MSEARGLRNLDTLRGVAILLVIAAHFSGGYLSNDVARVLANAGVILFFFLSGFLMDRTLAHDPRIGAYVVRRSFRILPMYWVSILIVMATQANWTTDQALANATFTAPLFGYERMSGVYWTLYIEVAFYCFAPFLRRAGEQTIAVAPLVFLAAIAANFAWRGVGSGAVFYVLFCLCGMQIGAWWRGTAKFGLVAATITIVSIAFNLTVPGPAGLGIVSLCCAVLLIVALKSPARFRFLSVIGAVSYSWYLLHMFGPYLIEGQIPSRTELPLLVVGTFAISAVTYVPIKRPVISMGKKLIEAGYGTLRRAYGQ